MKNHLLWKVILSLPVLLLISFGAAKVLVRSDWYFDTKTHTWLPPLFKKQQPCPSPLLNTSFADITQATGVLYPGQYRGTDYKPHGGIGFSRSEIDVKLPMDAKLIGGSRYYQNGDLQYILDFQNDCGIRFRFDHLSMLSPQFQTFADMLPEPKPDDTRGVRLKSAVFPAGTVVATAVGLPSMQNTGMDFGFYDLRQKNKIADNALWRALHVDELEHAAYGVCWFTVLPAEDSAKIKELEKQYGTDYPIEKAVSDYCSASGGTTLDQFNGQAPPEGY